MMDALSLTLRRSSFRRNRRHSTDCWVIYHFIKLILVERPMSELKPSAFVQLLGPHAWNTRSTIHTQRLTDNAVFTDGFSDREPSIAHRFSEVFRKKIVEDRAFGLGCSTMTLFVSALERLEAPIVLIESVFERLMLLGIWRERPAPSASLKMWACYSNQGY